jgi:sRNA-binding carbon storage regulator CsrA
MLCLKRQPGQDIVIWRGNDEIVVRITKVHANGSVSLGIDAPIDFNVDRLEIYRLKRAEEALRQDAEGNTDRRSE